jgi:hypothetical protein
MSKRGNPVMGHGSRKAFSQSVVHPVADSSNTDSGNPAAMRVPKGKAKNIVKGVGHPSAPRK